MFETDLTVKATHDSFSTAKAIQMLFKSISFCHQEYQCSKYAHLLIGSNTYCLVLKFWNVIDLSKLCSFSEGIFKKMENNMEIAENVLMY